MNTKNIYILYYIQYHTGEHCYYDRRGCAQRSRLYGG